MSVSNIVCRSGVGPTATIALFVTHGLGIGTVTPPSPETNSIGGGGGQPHRGNVYHSPGIHPHKAAELKQQEIIAKRVEAQELRILQKELQEIKDKQTARQKKVLETRYQGLLLEIHINNQELERLYIEYRNIQNMLALIMAMPWLNLGGETMH